MGQSYTKRRYGFLPGPTFYKLIIPNYFMVSVITRIAENVCKKAKATIDFAENKKILKELNLHLSTWMLNKVAAKMVRMAKHAQFSE